MNRRHITSPDLYRDYYVTQAQQLGGGPFFAGSRFQRGFGQRGGGIGSIFNSLLRKAMPILTNVTKHIGKVALRTGANVLSDAATGQSFQDSLRTRMRESRAQLKRDATNEIGKILNNQIGTGKKRKKSRKAAKKATHKKRKTSINSKPIKRKKHTKRVRLPKTIKQRTFQDIFG